MTGRTLHSSQLLAPLRILQQIALISGSVIVLIALVVFAIAFLATSPSGAARLAIVLITGLLLGVFGLVCALGWRSARMAMTVSTDGIEVRGQLRTWWLPWEQIARIETSGHWYWRQATCIVTTDGRRVIAIITSHQNLYLRGELSDEASRHPEIPTLPTRRAIEAHRRYLRGEFSGIRTP